MASQCDQCKTPVPQRARFCPRCGGRTHNSGHVFKVVMGIIIFVILLFVMMLFIAMPRSEVIEQSATESPVESASQH